MAELKKEMRARETLKAAFSNIGLQVSWEAGGRILLQAVQFDAAWIDCELSASKQRAAINDMATQKWDFVAIQAFAIDTLTAPVEKMIKRHADHCYGYANGTARPGRCDSFLAPDNEFMGVTQVLMDAMAGEGIVTVTQGALGQRCAEPRPRLLGDR